MTPFLIPRTRWHKVKGAKARNHLFTGIEQTPGLPFGAPRFAQEVAEWNAKAWPALAGGLVLAMLAGVAGIMLGLPWWAALLGALIGLMLGVVLVNNAISGTRGLEYRGKAIEWRAAVRFEGADAFAYLRSEAEELAPYRQFRGVPAKTIAAAIEARGDWADRWLDRRWPAIIAAFALGNPSSDPL